MVVELHIREGLLSGGLPHIGFVSLCLLKAMDIFSPLQVEFFYRRFLDIPTVYPSSLMMLSVCGEAAVSCAEVFWVSVVHHKTGHSRRAELAYSPVVQRSRYIYFYLILIFLYTKHDGIHLFGTKYLFREVRTQDQEKRHLHAMRVIVCGV